MAESVLKFKGSWRSYQKSILDALSFHLTDKKLHIAAAPGAGKTTLGIEVISRLNSPTLILCPTNTIKNQWAARIRSSFLEEKDYGIVSTDINTPKFITVITYQALLAAFTGQKQEAVSEKTKTDTDEEEAFYETAETMKGSKRFNSEKTDNIIKILKKAKISILCFDEAHHLRKEWWKALTYLNEELKPKQTLALTGTPPYDAEPDEWDRYEDLCGKIDEVISIPELVKNGDLCPHQDFIYFSGLTDAETAAVNDYNKKIELFMKKFFSDAILLEYMKRMPFLKPDEEQTANILDDPDFYVSMVIILKSAGFEIPAEFLELFNAKPREIPNLNMKYIKVFLSGFLFEHKEIFTGLEEKIESYFNLAKQSGLIHKNKIELNCNDNIRKQISNSIGKLDSVVKIAKLESKTLGKDLRMVVLADYIRENDTDNSVLGVVPIWRKLSFEFGATVSIGVLCGSLILIPQKISTDLTALLKEFNLEDDSVSVTKYKYDGCYLKITPKEAAKSRIVALITEMFNRGYINILVGTQSLLGEGWDAPCINSLILSSTVSSYMLSNQMRGRAIRIDKNNPDKVSNIWHLASVKIPEYLLKSKFNCENNNTDDNFFDINQTEDNSLYDIKQLEKRFEGYEAPSYFGNHEIVNGIARVLPHSVYVQAAVTGENAFLNLNGKTEEMAVNREDTRRFWQDALVAGYGSGRVSGTGMIKKGVNVPRISAKYLTYESIWFVFWGISVTYWISVSYIFCYAIAKMQLEFISCVIVTIMSVIIYAVICLRYLAKYLENGSIAPAMRNVALAIYETACRLDLIHTRLNDIRTGVEVTDYNGMIDVFYHGLSVEDNNFLINCLREFLDPIDNPRYILIKKSGKIYNPQTDYFAVPSAFSSKKSEAGLFKTVWEKYFGTNDKIVYVRNIEGRKLLLKARSNAYSAMKRPKSQKFSKWQ